MNKVLKMIGYSFLGLFVIVGVAVAYLGITGKFSEKKIDIVSLSFSTEQNRSVITDDLKTTVDFLPLNATKLDIELRAVPAGIITLPNNGKIKAGEPFTIKVNKDAQGNNIGGNVKIYASAGLASATTPMELLIDVAIATDGIEIYSSNSTDNLTIGGDPFDIYLYTKPTNAIRPGLSLGIITEYKDIKLSVADDSLSLSSSTKTFGYYDKDYLKNQKGAFSPISTQYHTERIDALKYVAKPLKVTSSVLISAKSLRTYGMQKDFVEVTEVQHFEAFGNYIDKYKDFIKADNRSYSGSGLNYLNGQEFIAGATLNINGQDKIVITSNSKYEAAMFYLFVSSQKMFSISDIEIKDLTTSDNTIQLMLHEKLDLNKIQLVEKFSLKLTPTDSNFTEQELNAKLGAVVISAVVYDVDAGGNPILGTEVLANFDYIEVKNPIDNGTFGTSNPIWTITVKNPQKKSNDGLRIKFTISENQNEYSDTTKISVKLNGIDSLKIKDDLGTLTINSPMNIYEQSFIKLDSSIIELTGDNPTYKTVKFFISSNSAKTAKDYYTVRLSDTMTNIKEHSMKNLNGVDIGVSGFEIEYGMKNPDESFVVLLSPINFKSGSLTIFAAVVQTDYLGQPMYDEGGNYIIVEKSNNSTFYINSSIGTLKFYSYNPSTNKYFKRDVNLSTQTLILLSDHAYTLYVSNAELDENGTFDHSYYNMQPDSSYIDFQDNLLFALEKYAKNSEGVVFAFGEGSKDNDSLYIETGEDGFGSYTYDDQKDLIKITLKTNPRNKTNTDDQNDNFPGYLYYITGNYTPNYLENGADNLNASILARVVYSNVDESDFGIYVKNNFVSDFSSSSITVEASATEGVVQWKCIETGDLFTALFDNVGLDTDVFYDTETGGIVYGNKYDFGYFGSQSMEDYARFIKEKIAYSWKVQPGFEDYLTILNPNDKLTGIKIKKGSASGITVKVTLTVMLHIDQQDVYLTEKSTDIYITIVQKETQTSMYSLKELASPVGQHLIKNSQEFALNIKGGEQIDVLADLDREYDIYEYNLSTTNNPQHTGESTRKLIASQYETGGTILGDLNFEIVKLSQKRPSIYFLDDAGEKVYKIKAERIGGDYSLVVYAENSTSNIDEQITIIDPFGAKGIYYFLVGSNIDIIAPTTENIKVDANNIDNIANLNEHYKAIQSYKGANYKLPISFTFTDDDSQSYARLLENNNPLYKYNIGEGDLEGFSGYVVGGEGDDVFAEKTDFYSTLETFRVLQEKLIQIKMFYYSPMLNDLGEHIYVTTLGQRLYFDESSPQYYYLEITGEEEVKVEYSGVKYFAFSKHEYELNSLLSKIIIKPTISIIKGNLLSEPINVKSGTDYNLNIAKTDRVLNPTETSFINISNIKTLQLLLPEDVTSTVVDFESIYKKYLKFSFVLTGLDQEDLSLYNMLNPEIINGVIKTQGINKDLSLTLRAFKLEGEEDIWGVAHIESNSYIDIAITFKNSVEFKVSNDIEVEDQKYITQKSQISNASIGHIYAGKNSVKTDGSNDKVIYLEQYSKMLYDKNNSINNNIINIADSSNGDRLKDNLTNINIYKFNGKEFVINDTNDIIEISWLKSGYSTNSIGLNFLRSVNKTEYFKLEFVASGLDLIGEYYFAVKSDIYISANYPILPSNEVVTRGTVLDLHSNYFNPNNRIVVSKTNYVENISPQSLYKKIVYIDAVSGHEIFFGEMQKVDSNGTHDEVITRYNLVYINNKAMLINTENELDIITIYDNHEVQTNDNVVFYSYTLLDENKQEIVGKINEILGTGFPRFDKRTTTNGLVEFSSNIADIRVIYIKVTLFNGTQTQYNIRIQPSVSSENVEFKNGEQTITETNPLIVYANTDFDIYKYIDVTKGYKQDIVIKYQSRLDVYKLSEGSPLNLFDTIINGDMLRFENIGSLDAGVVVEFLVYGKGFTSGMAPYKFYVLVMPDIIIENHFTELYAGLDYNLEYVDEENTGIFKISDGSGNQLQNEVGYEIVKIDSDDYDIDNIFGIKLIDGKITSVDLSKTLYVTIKITKTFPNLAEYSTLILMKIIPNANIQIDYNQSSYQSLTAPSALEGTSFIDLYDFVKVENFQGQQIATELVAFEMKTQTDLASIAGSVLTYKPSNTLYEIKVKIIITWQSHLGDQVYTKDINIRVKQNVTSTTVLYSESNYLNVYAGQKLEINFDTDMQGVKFISNNLNPERYVYVNAKQMDGQDINILLKETDNEFYKLFFYDGKYFIAFKEFTGLNPNIKIDIYLDLTGELSGVIDDISAFYKTGRTIDIIVNHSIDTYAIKDEYSKYFEELTPLVYDGKDYYEYKQSQDSTGSFDYIDNTYQHNENGTGEFDFVLNNTKYSYVGAGEGNYNFVGDSFVPQINGDHIKLSINQFDTFDFFKFSLLSSVGGVDASLSPLVDRLYLRTVLSYEYDSILIEIENGILTVFPPKTTKTVAVTIKIQLYNKIEEKKLYIKLVNGGFIVPVSKIIGTENTVNNNTDEGRWEVEVSSVIETVIDLKDYIYYGAQINSYTQEDLSVDKNIVSKDGYGVMIRGGVATVSVELDNTHISAVISYGTNIARIVGDTCVFTQIILEEDEDITSGRIDRKVNITVWIGEEFVDLYLVIVL